MRDASPQDGRVELDRDGLKRHRQRLGLSQEALAQHCFDRRLCVSIASIKRAESGRPVLYRTARHLAEVYGVPVAELAAPDAPAPDQGQAGGSPAAADLDALALDDESPRSLIRLVADGDAASLRRWVTSFGGTPATGRGGRRPVRPAPCLSQRRRAQPALRPGPAGAGPLPRRTTRGLPLARRDPGRAGTAALPGALGRAGARRAAGRALRLRR
ncbi:helix-turn-helix transcriptional regulator [Halomonas ramblicola]|uniref:helix-turn-helix transcriptional regulator n=1 Tax=Halomonas ramblicola TaxID=747349 RepID=UPI0025B3C7FA|nr:helix-turn-helix transcriptional regulator [Halomonas ramblicola]MDN3523596.1 helix-turn-helix transcriptional regulator [Halomonas ramblicola]